MKGTLLFVVCVGAVFAATGMSAQMHGGSGQTRQGQSQGSMQGGPQGGMQGGMQGAGSHGMGVDMGTGNTMPTPAQRRHVLHTTTKQDQQYRSCAQAMDRLRHHVDHMSHSSPAQTTDPQQADNSADQQADDPGDQLSSDVQDLEQDLDNLFDGFNSNQQAALAAQIKDLKKKTSQLTEWSQQLKVDLANKNSNPKKIQEAVRRIDKLTKQIQKEQRAVAVALGIDA